LNVFKARNYCFELRNKTLIMGILNITPDSFSDSGTYESCDKAVKRAFEIQNLGADILDIGGQSTRPGFQVVSELEEWNRILPVLKEIIGRLDIPISVDTFYPSVAQKAIDLGADIINDVSGCKSSDMLKVISKSKAGIVITHSDNQKDIRSFFEEKLEEAMKLGISKDRICLDPGIGFSKDRQQDRWIIKNLKSLKIEGVALLIGLSRKRLVAQYCENGDNCSRLPGTVAANTLAIQQGANIIRVHDVKEAVFAARLTDAILSS